MGTSQVHIELYFTMDIAFSESKSARSNNTFKIHMRHGLGSRSHGGVLGEAVNIFFVDFFNSKPWLRKMIIFRKSVFGSPRCCCYYIFLSRRQKPSPAHYNHPLVHQGHVTRINPTYSCHIARNTTIIVPNTRGP